MSPTNGNQINDINFDDEETRIINETKEIIQELTSISLKIRYYTNYINLYWNSNKEEYKNKVKLYLIKLKEIYEKLPKFVKDKEVVTAGNCWKSIKFALSVITLSIGIGIRVAQRYFSVAVVSDPDIVGKSVFEQMKILVIGMGRTLITTENYAMASIDTFLSYMLSYYPFGLKNIVNLFVSNQSIDREVLNQYLPLEIVVQELQKSLAAKKYQELKTINLILSRLCNDLKIITAKPNIINYLQDVATNSKSLATEFNRLIDIFGDNDKVKELLSKFLSSDLKDELQDVATNSKSLATESNRLIDIFGGNNQIKELLSNILRSDLKDELQDVATNSKSLVTESNRSTDILGDIDVLNELLKSDLKNEDYSFKKITKNSWNNSKVFLTTLIINHLVITAASSYTAQTLTWETYKENIVSINNILSTVVRATIMKLVNEYLIKNALNTMFKPVYNYFWPNNDNNDHTLIRSFKNWFKNQKKVTQTAVFIISFIVITTITNAIKTYAADITQKKGDWAAAWIQFCETFPKWEMLLSALAVTSSDLYNLTTNMKPVFKLRYEKKEQQKIIDKKLFKSLNMIDRININSNGSSSISIEEFNSNIIQHCNGSSSSSREEFNNSIIQVCNDCNSNNYDYLQEANNDKRPLLSVINN